MIYGIGCDIVEVSRFKKNVEKSGFIDRFFNKEEKCSETSNVQYLSEYYAARFAVKEAFSKALGTGIIGFDLRDVFVKKNSEGCPYICVTGRALEVLHLRCGQKCNFFVSISHEKNYAMAYVVIEKEDGTR